MPDTKSAAGYPEYVTFRTAVNGGRLLTVVAALEPADGSLFPWAMRCHAQAPSGEFRKVPDNHFRLRIDTAVAKSIIDAIKRVNLFLPSLALSCRSSNGVLAGGHKRTS
jgi:hypothetical protein